MSRHLPADGDCSCCCKVCVPCINGTVPNQFQVIVSGSIIEEFHGTHILDFDNIECGGGVFCQDGAPFLTNLVPKCAWSKGFTNDPAGGEIHCLGLWIDPSDLGPPVPENGVILNVSFFANIFASRTGHAVIALQPPPIVITDCNDVTDIELTSFFGVIYTVTALT